MYNSAMSEWNPWTARWEQLFHQQLDLAPEQLRGLPLALRRFHFARATLSGAEFTAALDTATATPRAYRQHQQQLEGIFGKPVVFFLQEIPGHLHRRLIKAGVPFFTPDGPVYIPQLYLYIPSRQPASSARQLSSLSPAAQLLLLRQITFGDMHGRSLTCIADTLRYSPMSITNAKNELTRHKRCRYEGSKTRGVLLFNQGNPTLWQQAQGILRSPAIRRHYISSIPTGLPLAGESALAAQTLLADGELPTYAISKQQLRDFLSEHHIRECDPEDAAAILEQWMYPPDILATPGSSTVDPYSLTLSLRHSADERVQQELTKLLPSA